MLDSMTARLVLLVLCSTLFVICDSLAANWGKKGSRSSLFGMILLAPFSYVSFGFLNQRYPLAIVTSWVALALCVSSVLIGIFYFRDKLSIRQGAGVLLAIVAITLMSS